MRKKTDGQLSLDLTAPAVAPGAAAAAIPEQKNRQPDPAEKRRRAAMLHERLRAHGLRTIDRVILMHTRTVMVSVSGSTLRVNDAYAEAPDSVISAISAFTTARSRKARKAATDIILAYSVDTSVHARRSDQPRKSDTVPAKVLGRLHEVLNEKHFGGRLGVITIRFSGRMVRRLGHYDPGNRNTAPEIVISRRHVMRDGMEQAAETLLHEMVHQWQHESGLPIDHGSEFRKKAREVGIAPSSRRKVT